MQSATSPGSGPALVIIGNGVAGITAARVARKLCRELSITVISAESDLFFSRTALMYIYMGHLREQDTQPYPRQFYAENRIDLVRGAVVSVSPETKRVQLADGRSVAYDYLLLAVGSVTNRFGWPGQDARGVQGLVSLQDLALLEENTRERPKHAVIVGGGLIGIELCEMLHTRHIPVTFLVRESSYMNHLFPGPESALINGEIARQQGVELLLGTQLREIQTDATGRATGVVTDDGQDISCELVGLTTGVAPNLELARTIPGLQLGRGIRVDAFQETSLSDVFAAGDCAEISAARGAGAGAVEQLWYTGRMQGEVAGHNIAARALQRLGRIGAGAPVPYDRGIWFNSAKFFHLEWQTYGFVPRDVEAAQSFWWQDATGRRGIRIVWQSLSGARADTAVTGFHFFGIRARQTACEHWIRTQASVEQTVAELEAALFDPEFTTSVLPQLREAFGRARSPRRGVA